MIIPNADVLLRGLDVFDDTPKMDFVDCLLCGYKSEKGVNIVTFDKKLRKRLDNISFAWDYREV